MLKLMVMAKEGQSWAAGHLANLYKGEGHDVFLYYFMPHEEHFKHSDFKTVPKEFGVRGEGCGDVARAFLASRDSAYELIDWDYIKHIEDNYCTDYLIGEQVYSSQIFSSFWHYRDYHKRIDWYESLLILQIYYQYVEALLDREQPDFILDTATEEYGRSIVYQVAKNRNIPYIVPEHTKLGEYHIPSFSFGMTTDPWFEEAYQKILNSEYSEKYEEATNFLIQYRNKDSVLNEDEKQYIKDNAHSFLGVVSRFLKHIYGFCRNNGVLSYLTPNRNRGIVSNPWKKLTFEFKYWMRLYFRPKMKNIFSVYDKSEKFILVPLHYLPESSTFLKSLDYFKEDILLEWLVKKIPSNYVVFAKEHRSMIAERPAEYYKRLKSNGRIRVISPYEKTLNPEYFIKKTKAVITLTGTTALEAAMLGKPAATLGVAPFSVIDSIAKLKSPGDVEEFVNNLEKHFPDEKQVIAYIAAVMEYGVKIKIYNISRWYKFYNTSSSSDIIPLKRLFDLCIEGKHYACTTIEK